MGTDTPAEQDLLLPRDIEQRSDVAHNSRARCFNEKEHGKEEEVPGDEQRRRSIFNDVGAIILGTCIMLSLVMVVFLPSGNTEDPRSPAPPTISQRVDRILEETPLLDGHNDLAILIRFLHKNKIYDSHFTTSFEEGGMYGHVDLPRLKEGKNGGAFWSAYAPCPKNGTDFSDENYAESKSCSEPKRDQVNNHLSIQLSLILFTY